MEVKINKLWQEWLKGEFEQPYFTAIKAQLIEKKQSGESIYPPGPFFFNAFDLTPPDQLKVVILGQDPYHNPGEAMGLCFSVPGQVRIPPSLKNVFKELRQDLNITPPATGDLTQWAQQGVFLLNAVLTVSKHQPASHRQIGWMDFTDAVIRIISERKEHVVFILWGNFAKSKKHLIDTDRHLIIEAAHPSPLARTGFAGHRPFSRTNQYLTEHNIAPINWEIN
ncbi:MAG TPA: uracil-DNA glycosylase [Saprospiraceae bacterium]|nr:uracil-DNA glycosylase [Saprospiraceae bacterium]HQW56877.1 uracil-DNA glycosylase [Saprospiraceae bacterium]